MLEIINNLAPFFEDCYRRISVREYSKIIKVSPPTASKILMEYYKEGLLKRQEEIICFSLQTKKIKRYRIIKDILDG